MSVDDGRIQEIMEQLMAYARLDFDKKIQIDTREDELTAISAGVNMLGEELKVNTITLREKERLLKELHHRVKNNMQIIVSMLRLQTAGETDPKILEFVRDSKSRIDSMALVHEMLYSSDGFEFTQLKEYVDFLQRSIFMSYAPPGHEIKVNLNISEDCLFNVDRMIPLGLIMNELFSNSLKHAFPTKKGVINVEGLKVGKRQHVITYEDDGVGLPEGFVVEEAESLGMQLIQMLVEQIDGTYRIGNLDKNEKGNYGFRLEIRF
ncbi:MAG: sensor histidine kinase [Crocinitomicaceae bacterium]|nr:sensor histidine kinase [Crocinitomicaceae bacterium]